MFSYYLLLNIEFERMKIIVKMLLIFGMLSIVCCNGYNDVFVCRRSHYKNSEEAEDALDNINFHEVDA